MLVFGDLLSVNDYVGARRRCYETCASYDRLLGDDTVLITPTANAESWPLRRTVTGDGVRRHRSRASA